MQIRLVQTLAGEEAVVQQQQQHQQEQEQKAPGAVMDANRVVVVTKGVSCLTIMCYLLAPDTDISMAAIIYMT